MTTNLTETETKQANEILNASMVNTVGNLLTLFGVEGIFEATFNAIYATVSNYYYQTEETGTDNTDLLCTLRNVLDEVYVLCEKGKAEAVLIDTCQRKQQLTQK